MTGQETKAYYSDADEVNEDQLCGLQGARRRGSHAPLHTYSFTRAHKQTGGRKC